MFGYLQVQKSELLVREYDSYKAVYCALCKQMGKDYSFLTRLSLSYDCTFYAMLIMSVKRSCKGFKDGRCTCNPLKKCKFAVDNSDSLRKAAAFSVISGYYKLKDDISDSRFIKSLAFRFLLPFFSHWRKKAMKNYPDIDRLVSNMMNLQYEAEHSNRRSVDFSAHPTADMIGSLFSLEAENDVKKRVFYEFGYQLGRWIYLTDAADDIKNDIKNKNFNPFIDIETGETSSEEYISNVLNQSLGRAYEAYILMDIIDFKGILDNMMLKGFPTIQNKVTGKLTEVNDE